MIVTQEYKKLKNLGEGAFGQVWEVEGQDKQLYAMKFVRKAKLKTQGVPVQYIRREMRSCVDSKFVCRIIRSYEDSEYFYIIFDLCESNLLQCMKNRPEKYSPEKGGSVAAQILQGIHDIHRSGMAHRDIKPDNILKVRNEERYVISDFGFIKEISQSLRTYLGTSSYMAPEIIMRAPSYSCAVDIWSFGVLLFVMFYNMFPFEGQRQVLKDSILKWCTGKFNLAQLLKSRKYKKTCSEAEQEIFEMVFVIDPKERASIEALYRCKLLNPHIEKERLTQSPPKAQVRDSAIEFETPKISLRESTTDLQLFKAEEKLMQLTVPVLFFQKFIDEDYLDPPLQSVFCFQILKLYFTVSRSVALSLASGKCFLPVLQTGWKRIAQSGSFRQAEKNFSQKLNYAKQKFQRLGQKLKEYLAEGKVTIKEYKFDSSVPQSESKEARANFRKVSSSVFLTVGRKTQAPTLGEQGKLRMWQYLAQVMLLHAYHHVFKESDVEQNFQEVVRRNRSKGRLQRFDVNGLLDWLEEGRSVEEYKAMIERINKKYF